MQKFSVRYSFDSDQDTTYRFNSRREAREALENRMERAAHNVQKYFDNYSERFSKQLAYAYDSALNQLSESQVVQYKFRDLKDDLESLNIKYYSTAYYRKDELADQAQITSFGDKYGYNAYAVLDKLEDELMQYASKICDEAYDLVCRRYLK